MSHPQEEFLRPDSFPTVWCSGCGIGSVLHAFIDALVEKKDARRMPLIAMGLGCTQKIGECLELESFSLSHGRAVDFSIQYLKDHPDGRVICFLNNADFMLTGAEDFLKARGSKVPLLIIYINNFIYTVSGSEGFPMTPYLRKSVGGEFELPFNIPRMAMTIEADYGARWTPLRVGWLKYSIMEALDIQGLSVIEILNPCLIYESENRRLLNAAERMKFYDEKTRISHFAPSEEWDIRRREQIIIGKFIDRNSREKSAR